MIETKELVLLLGSPVGELSVGSSVGGNGEALSFRRGHPRQVLLAEAELLNSCIHLVEGGDVAHEVVVDLLHHSGRGNGSEGG